MQDHHLSQPLVSVCWPYGLPAQYRPRLRTSTREKLGCNHPIGPLALADMIGLDVLLSVMQILHDEFADSKYRPCPLLKELVAAGHLGRKSGRGVFTY